jgi:hypothetical protein
VLAKELHDVAPGVIAGLDAEVVLRMKVGLASVDQSGMNKKETKMLLWMMFPLAVWGGSDKTGSFDLWKTAALPWLMSVGDGESNSMAPPIRPSITGSQHCVLRARSSRRCLSASTGASVGTLLCAHPRPN